MKKLFFLAPVALITLHSCASPSLTERNPAAGPADTTCSEAAQAIMRSSLSTQEARNTEFLLSPDVFIKKLFEKDAQALKFLKESSEARESIVKNGLDAMLSSATTTQKAFIEGTAIEEKLTYYMGSWQAISISPNFQPNKITQLLDAIPQLFVSDALILSSPAEKKKYALMINEALKKLEPINEGVADLHLAYRLKERETEFRMMYSTLPNKTPAQIEAAVAIDQDEFIENFRKTLSVGDLNSVTFIKYLFNNLVAKGFESSENQQLLLTVLSHIFNETNSFYGSYIVKAILDNSLTPSSRIKNMGNSPEVEKIASLWRKVIRAHGQHPLSRASVNKVTTSQFIDKVAVRGKISEFIMGPDRTPIFVKYSGEVSIQERSGTDLSRGLTYKTIKGQEESVHNEGFSSPLGNYVLKTSNMSFNSSEVNRVLLKKLADDKTPTELHFGSGYKVKGILSKIYAHTESGEVLVVRFEDCDVYDESNKLVYNHEWGAYDFIVHPIIRDVK